MSCASSQSSSPDKDAKLTVDFDIEEDVEAELSEFSRLSYTGHFEEAEVIFRECLSAHQNLFPIAAEYGDFLLRQERFEDLSLFSSEKLRSSIQNEEEHGIFRLMKLITELQLKSSPEGLNEVERLWSLGLQISLTSTSDIQQHLLDLFLRIAAIDHSASAHLNSRIARRFAPFGAEWKELKRRYESLLRDARFWEAQGLLGYCVKISDMRRGSLLLFQYYEAVRSVGVSQDETRMALRYLVATMIQINLVAEGQHFIEEVASLQELEAAPDDSRTSPIHSAVKYGQLESLLVLLDQGDDPAALDGNGQTPLHLAAYEGDVEISEALITRGASPNHQNWMGQLPLHLAAKNGHTEAVIVLIDQSSPLDTQDSNSWTPFSLAAQGDHWRIVEILLDENPALCINDLRFEAIMRSAADHGDVKAVQRLIKAAMEVPSPKKRRSQNAVDVQAASHLVHRTNEHLDNSMDAEARKLKSSHFADDGTSTYMSTKRVKVDSPRQIRNIIADDHPFICVFARYGCAANFSSKNEWKRHVSS